MPSRARGPQPADRHRRAPAQSARGAGLLCLLLMPMLLLAAAPMAQAAGTEIHSNGRGGGPWSDPETWLGGRVPGPEDAAVIAMRDQVIFDGNDDSVSCRELHLDPEALLTFEEGNKPRTLTVAGPVESYGTIRIDGTTSRRGEYELRLVGASEEQRTIRLMPHAALLLYGNEQHRDGERNVRIRGASLEPDAARLPVRMVADGRVMLDLHHTLVEDVAISLANLDNTGAQAGERLNVVGNHFAGAASFALRGCDTPLLRDNTFQTDRTPAPEVAIRVDNCSLAQVRGNKIQGPYGTAILVDNDNNSSIIGCEIAGSKRGVWLKGENIALTSTTITDSDRGVMLYHARAVIRDVEVRRSALSYDIERSTTQIVNSSAPEASGQRQAAGKEGLPPLALNVRWWSTLLLINTPIEPKQIETGGGTQNEQPFAETMQYLVVKVVPKAGSPLPEGLRVQVETAGKAPAGPQALNVRNSPAIVSPDGLTPLPDSQEALTVRSWQIDAKGAIRPAPSYKVMVQAPSANGDGSYKTLVEKVIEPDAAWFRPEPNRPEPTIEVTLP